MNYGLSGAVLVLEENAVLEMHNCQFMSNFALQNGMFEIFNSAHLKLYSSTLKGNKAINSKHLYFTCLDAIGVAGYSSLSIDNSTLEDNIIISKSDFAVELLDCQMFCHFTDAFVIETTNRVKTTQLEDSLAEIFNLRSTFTIQNNTYINNQQ